MRIAINSISKRGTLNKGLVCRWIKYLLWRKGCQGYNNIFRQNTTQPEVVIISNLKGTLFIAERLNACKGRRGVEMYCVVLDV